MVCDFERGRMVNKEGDKELFLPPAVKLSCNNNKVVKTQCHLSFWHCVNETKLILWGQGSLIFGGQEAPFWYSQHSQILCRYFKEHMSSGIPRGER